MAIFRSKPVEIEAWQYHPKRLVRGVCNCDANAIDHLHTMHNDQIVFLEDGDWIVPEPVPNRFYPIKPDVFAKKYELVR